jgi:hypothetical protein
MFCFLLAFDTSRLYLAKTQLITQAEAAALAAAFELDGTAESGDRAARAANAMALSDDANLMLEFAPDQSGPWSGRTDDNSAVVRARLARRIRGLSQIRGGTVVSASAVAGLRAVERLEAETALAIDAEDSAAADYGFLRGAPYRLDREGRQGQPAPEPGQLVAVRIGSGAPKNYRMGWAAFRITGITGDAIEATYEGGYLKGAKHPAAKPAGYFEAALLVEVKR